MPTYVERVSKAIYELKERKGSSFCSIKNYMRLPKEKEKYIRAALKKGRVTEFRNIKRKYLYKPGKSRRNAKGTYKLRPGNTYLKKLQSEKKRKKEKKAQTKGAGSLLTG
jgi:hypothetical protein